MIQVAGQSTDLDMSALPDNHGVIAVAHERTDGLVRDVNERTGRLDDLEPERACPGESTL